jgi:HK97 family phage portal protein
MRFPFFSKASAPVEQKAAGTVYTLEGMAQAFFGIMGFSSGGVTVSKEVALQVPAVFCAVRVIAEGVSAMPVELKERNMTGKGRWKTRTVRGHWASKLLSVRPNSWQTPAEFIEGMTICAALTGQALAVKNTVKVGNRKEVRELLPVPPGNWTVEQDENWGLLYRVHYSDKFNRTFTQDEVLILRGATLNGYEGLPAIKYAAEAIGLSSSLASMQGALAARGGQPSGILTSAATLDEEARANLKKVWEEKYGPGKAGGIAVLENGWDFKTMTMTSVDGQVLESRRFQIEEIARAYRVLPLMIMQADKASTFASVEQMSRMHVTHTLMPWVTRWEQALVRDVLAGDEALFFDFDETMLLRGDHKDQGEFFQKALGAGGVPGFMTVNEVRDRMGLAPVEDEWADEIPRGSQSENLQSAPSPDGETPPPKAPEEEAA